MRQRFVATPAGLVPAEEYYAAKRERDRVSPNVLPDIEPFVSPIDRQTIGSRSQLREHERRHEVRQVGNDLNRAVERQFGVTIPRH